jgi:bla regulator protein blaR1
MSALINHLVQSTLFLGVVWLITLALRSHSAALRHTLWFIASLKFLVPFSALYVVGAALGLPLVLETPPPLFIEVRAAAAPVVTPVIVADTLATPWLAITLGAAWATVSLLLALRWWRASLRAAALIRTARPAPGTSLAAHISDTPVEPSVSGVLHPVVLLPAALPGQLTRHELDAVLAHEHEHIARHDILKARVHRVVETLFWFHPLVWWLGAKLLDERERACDEAVIAQGHGRGDYAAALLAVCRHCVALPATRTVGALAGDLTRRVRRILDDSPPAALGALKALSLMSLASVVVAAPLLAGAVDDTARRGAALLSNSRALAADSIVVDVAVSPADATPRIDVQGREVRIEGQSLRELVALAYGVPRWEVRGGATWLDSPRYDIRARTTEAVRAPEDFDPLALRGLVTKLLASRFDLEIHVNQRCQEPCRRHAPAPPDPR